MKSKIVMVLWLLQILMPMTSAFSQGGGFGGGGGGGGSGGGGRSMDGPPMGTSGTFSISSRTALSDRPAVVVTRPMNAQTQTEWKEDLNVMDKLLRDEIGRVSGERPPTAMGIRLMMFGNAEPMYIEGCGALFSCTLNVMPLAGSDASTVASGADASEASAWERAKNEIAAGRTRSDGPTAGSSRATSAATKFDQAKLDELVDSILKTLPQAKNMRHLGAEEFVIVTMAGFSEAGSFTRLTLKASKSDIDGVASGRLKPEEFRARIASNFGLIAAKSPQK